MIARRCRYGLEGAPQAIRLYAYALQNEQHGSFVEKRKEKGAATNVHQTNECLQRVKTPKVLVGMQRFSLSRRCSKLGIRSRPSKKVKALIYRGSSISDGDNFQINRGFQLSAMWIELLRKNDSRKSDSRDLSTTDNAFQALTFCDVGSLPLISVIKL